MSAPKLKSAAPSRTEIEGLIALHNAGRLQELERKSRKLAKRFPNVLIILELLGAALAGQDKLSDAVGCFQRIAKMTPDNPEAHYNLGLALQKSGRLDAAVLSYRKSLELAPGNPVTLSNLGIALAAQEKFEEAIEAYRRALAAAPDYAEAHNNLALALKQLGQLDESREACQRAIELRPDYGEAHNNLGNILLDLDRADEALAHFREALVIDPETPGVHFSMGMSLQKLDRRYEAIESFQKVLSDEPDNIEALCSLGELYENTNQTDLAGETMEKCFRVDPGNTRATLLKGILQRRNGNFEEAIPTLEKLLSVSKSHTLNARAHNELGLAYDRLQESGNAFEHFQKSNELNAQLAAEKGIDKHVFLESVRRTSEILTGEWIKSWKAGPPDEPGETPAFVLGFPRSGTTLLDQILDTHPKIQVMEEPTILLDILPEVTPDPNRLPAILADMEPANIEAVRQSYFREAKTYVTRRPGSLLIEKNPLNTCIIPLIVRLFPEARIVFCLRHPCDVVLSCFMQNFIHTSPMANFYDLKDTAYSYSQVMRLWLKCKAHVPMNVHLLRYEDLLCDFNREVSALLTFLGLEWDDAVRNFTEHARGREIRTASYQAVTEGLNTRAQDRWKRYEEQLAPFMDELRPFIEAFGYAE